MERPILFNTEMVKAILEGRKTCTRRALKQPFEIHPNGFITKPRGNERLVPYKPIYQVGDILWVRETWSKVEDFVNYAEVEMDKNLKYLYKCDDNGKEHSFIDVGVKKWHPSIHMPRDLARIFLKVTNVRVERLQDIDLDGMHKEGILPSCVCGGLQKQLQEEYFKPLWDGLYKNWDANPLVWVIEFERVNS
ncbi:hypothetical protein [Clostridium sp. YIM B02551]|uniref:hypothetical protein n=1 Tax=Clostridium sp. YIM B02551 TaxID=2910679 RepID=UPI001EEAD2B3|nr:hypothetical protein [Clostridium sp. YIM B02551]